MNLSGVVRLTDLNDFIAPSQACVVKLDGKKATTEPQGSVQLQGAPKRGGFAQTYPSGGDGAIKVTLHDCLACSGCITSAETVLLEHQSAAEFEAKCRDSGCTVVVSVSPQSRAALAAYYGLTPAATLAKLTGFFKGLGAHSVLDIADARDVALLEAAAEFLTRYRAAYTADTGKAGEPDAERAESNGHASPSGRPAPPQPRAKRPGRPGSAALAPGNALLPVLASACPGWVCYAEKTHGDFILPFLSTIKSPQAVMGSLIKRHLAARAGVQPGRVYHCSVMPCYDKKLEASREDFQVPGTGVAETDCVLTTGEVQRLLEARSVVLGTLPETPLDGLLGGSAREDLTGVPGGSGGYLEFVYRTAAAELYGCVVPPGPLPLRSLRNADMREIALEVDGRPVLRFAAVYGFRNIQTLVQKMKRGGCEYDFVEVMACPAGCLNGGGQLPPGPGQTPEQLLAELDSAYHHPEVLMRHPADNPAIGQLYTEWIGGPKGSEAARALLHTGYHKRERPATTALSDW